MATLDRITDNVYHVDSDPYVPPLYLFLQSSLEYFTTNPATPAQVDAYYQQFIPLITNLKESYDYSSLGIRTLINDNIVAILALGHGSLPFDKDLSHLILILDEFEAISVYQTNLETTVDYFSYYEIEYPNFINKLIRGNFLKENLLDLIFYKPIVMTEQQEWDLFYALLDQISPSDFLYPVKDLYKETLEVKKATTSTDLVLATLNLFVDNLTVLINDVIPTVSDLDTSLSTRISVSGYTSSYLNLVEAEALFVPQELKNYIIKTGYTVTYVINNVAQNWTVDDELISQALVLDNHELELIMNSLVLLFNTYLMYQSLMVNYIDIENEIANQNQLQAELEALTTELNAHVVSIQANGPIIESVLLDLGTQIDIKVGQISQSSNNMQSLAQTNYDLGQTQRNMNFQSTSGSSSWASLLTDKMGFLEGLLGLSSAQLLGAQGDLQAMLDALSDNLLEVKALALAISLHNDPNETVRSFFNVLAMPIEAALLVTNAVICTLKMVQCALCVVKAGIIKAIDKVTELWDKAQKLFNSDTDYFGFIDDLKDKVVDAFNSIMEGSICSTVQTQKAADQDALRTALQGTGLSDAGGVTNLTDKQEIFNSVVSNSCAAHFASIGASVMNVLTTEFDNFVDEIQASVENTIDNLESLVNGGCSTCPDMKLGSGDLGFKFPSIKGLHFRVPDFVLKIPYLDSKVIKC